MIEVVAMKQFFRGLNWFCSFYKVVAVAAAAAIVVTQRTLMMGTQQRLLMIR
jgi:hypothetical protein